MSIVLEDANLNVAEQVNVLFKSSLGFPSTKETTPWFQETSVKYNNYINGDEILLDEIPDTPTYNPNITNLNDVKVLSSQLAIGGYIKEDTTGVIRHYHRLILTAVPNSDNNSYYALDTEGNNILTEGLQFNTKWSGTGDKNYPYALYTENFIAADSFAPDELGQDRTGGNWLYDLKNGIIFFPDYSSTLCNGTTNRPVFSFYKYIGRKGVSKQISVKDNTGSVTDPENNQIVVQTDDNTIYRYETTTNKWVAIGGSGGGSGTATDITSQNSINLLSGEIGDWYKVGDDLDGSPGDKASFNSLSKDGKTIVVGHYQANSNYGKVVVYQLIGSKWTQKGSQLTAGGGWAGYSVDISSDGTIVAYSSKLHDTSTSRGTVTVYRWKGSDWEKMGKDLDGEPSEKFGQSVALSSDGTILAASSNNYDSNRGVVRIWEWSGTEWVKMDNDIVGSKTDGYTGSQIDLSDDGKTVAIVSVFGVNNNGYAQVFEWTGSVWKKKGLNIDFGPDRTDAISINSNGTIVAVGGYYHDNYKGIVKVYQWNGNAWELRGTELKNNIVDQKGDSVFLNDIGNILAVGSPSYDTVEGNNLGRVTIYKWNTYIKDWVEIKQILGEPGDLIGNTGTISLNGDGTMISIGSRYHDSNKGTVRIYSNRKYLFSGELTVSGGGDFTGDLTVNGNNITNGNSTINGNINFTGNLLKNGEIYKETNLVNSFSDSWSQIGTDLDGETGDVAGASMALSSDGSIVAVSAFLHDINKGTVRVYQWNGSSWNKLGIDLDGEAGDNAGASVALSSDGTIVAVGAYNHDNSPGTNEGTVRVYQWNGTSWIMLGTEGELDGQAGDNAGQSVALSGDGTIVAVGASSHDSNKGTVRVYQWNGSIWNKLGIDLDGQAGDYAGASVALNGDGTIVAVGAYYHDSDYKGTVRVYQWNGYSWNMLGNEGDLDGLQADNRAGSSVAISSDGNILAIGVKGHGKVASTGISKGTARVYQWNGSSWKRLGTDVELEGELADDAGNSVALSSDGTIVAVGADNHDNTTNSDEGTVRVYQWNGTSWNMLATEGDLDGQTGDYAGGSVALSSDGTIVAVGAGSHDSGKGTARVYTIQKNILLGDLNIGNELTVNGNSKINGNINFTGNLLKNGEIYKETNLVNSFSDSWSQLGIDLDGEAGDSAGMSVALSSDGTIVAFGLRYHDNQKGTVRVYQWNGTSWNKLGIDLDGETGDKAGESVALNSDGTIVAVGADNHDGNKGTVRVYQWNGTSWNKLGIDLDGENWR